MNTIDILKIRTTEINTVLKIEVLFFIAAMYLNAADDIAKSVDPNQTAPRSSLTWDCTVCPDISILLFRIFMIHTPVGNNLLISNKSTVCAVAPY